MIETKGYAAHGPETALVSFSFERRDVGANDILIDIQYCGICHTDIHQTKGEWGNSVYPMVPGRNIKSDVEIIPITKVEEAYDRTLRADVRYRFVIDMATL